MYTYQDVNKDGKLDANDKLLIKELNNQTVFGGLANHFSYKNIQLDVFFQFVKQAGYNYLNYYAFAGFENYNIPVELVRKAWQKPGDKTSIQQFSQGGVPALVTAASNLTSSDYAISDASFIRLKNVALSYSLPSGWQQKAKLRTARIYVQCQNLLTITSYKGLDPETQGKSLAPLRMVTAGVQVSL
jgi:hypothetical protein